MQTIEAGRGCAPPHHLRHVRIQTFHQRKCGPCHEFGNTTGILFLSRPCKGSVQCLLGDRATKSCQHRTHYPISQYPGVAGIDIGISIGIGNGNCVHLPCTEVVTRAIGQSQDDGFFIFCRIVVENHHRNVGTV